MIETDTTEANGGFVFAAGVGDDDDGMRAVENGSGPRGVLAAEANVNAAFQMSSGEFVRVASVEDLRAVFL